MTSIKKYNLHKRNYVFNPKYKKRKLKGFDFRDGILSFSVSINKTCHCGLCKKTYCEHIIYILFRYYQLSLYTITLCTIKPLWNIIWKSKFIDVSVIVDTYLKDNMCGVCLDPLATSELFQCNNCSQLTHQKCIKKWFVKKKSCIYCNKTCI